MGDLGAPAAVVAGVAGLCAVWWTLEPIPIPATSLVPFAVLPFAGVLDQEAAAAAFGHPLVLLLMGGFLLSTVMESSGAHQRVALVVIRALGGHSARRVVLGFMVACAGLSMWISNTATTLMLLPVAGAVLARCSRPEALAVPLVLGLAWSASIGGLGTPVGTPPNALLLAELQSRRIFWGFADFMAVGLPVVALLVPAVWVWLCRGRALDGVSVEVPELPPVRAPEGRALLLFGVTVVAWVTRTAPFGGWSGWLDTVGLDTAGIGDHTVALAMVVVAFLLPNGEGEPLLVWKTAVRIPWGLLLLFAGGIALGTAFRTSGLDQAVADGLGVLGALPLVGTVFALCLSVTFLTEITSNTATAALLMPILGTAATDAGDPVLSWLVPAALSASCAFMLPVATAPNAIVVGAGHVRTGQMAREGLMVNLFGAIGITLVTWWVL
jgi:sodium-dependent dicarboxylate transporter 2/3/5